MKMQYLSPSEHGSQGKVSKLSEVTAPSLVHAERRKVGQAQAQAQEQGGDSEGSSSCSSSSSTSYSVSDGPITGAADEKRSLNLSEVSASTTMVEEQEQERDKADKKEKA